MKNDKQNENEKKPQKISDLGENIRGALCYVLGFVSGVFFLLTEKENKFVRFHAMQSVVVFLSMTLLMMIPFVGLFIAPLSLILWLFLMYKAYQGEKYKLPTIGDFAEKQAEKFLK